MLYVNAVWGNNWEIIKQMTVINFPQKRSACEKSGVIRYRKIVRNGKHASQLRKQCLIAYLQHNRRDLSFHSKEILD